MWEDPPARICSILYRGETPLTLDFGLKNGVPIRCAPFCGRTFVLAPNQVLFALG